MLRRSFAAGAFLAIALAGSARSDELPTVAFAGFGYAGDAVSKAKRFPYSLKYDNVAEAEGSTLFKRINALLNQAPPQHFQLGGSIDSLRDRDQALVSALVVTSETVSFEQFGRNTKLLAVVRAQALFFDFKTQTVVRSYPLSFGKVDVFDHKPDEPEIFARVRAVYEGSDGKPGILQRYATALLTATLPTKVSRTLQVKTVVIKPEFAAVLPAELSTTPTIAQAWAADLVSEALSGQTGVPMLPFMESEAVNKVMTMQVSDGDVYNLAVPDPDYRIEIVLNGVKKVKYGEVPAGASYIYGTYANVRVLEPVSGQIFLDTALKNGEVKLVPATQTSVDDFPAIYDSVNGLFKKLAASIAGTDTTWIKSAASAPDIAKQISTTNELFRNCQ